VIRRSASFPQHPGSDAAWSPDGGKLAFRVVRQPRAGSSRAQPPGQDLVSTRIDGRERQVLVRGRSWVGHPAWSPDGAMLSFATAPPGGPIELWVVGADGSDARPLLRGLGGVSVSWSRDRRKLAAGVGPGRGRVAPGLYALRLPRGKPRHLAPESSDSAWSPDDRTIAFGSGDRVETVRPDGRGRRTVARLPGARIVYVAWSPSGREIAFTALSRPPSQPGPPPSGTR
jgi:dipeptidyl aminopeptidase/acylaminoacyl peptidase